MAIIVILIVLSLLVTGIVYAKQAFSDPIGDTIHYDAQLRIFPGGGCNSIVLTSDDGKKALIVDTKYFKGARHMRANVHASDIVIVNTHFHMDHARGNRLYPNAFIISGTAPWKLWDFDTGRSKRPDTALAAGDEISLKIGSETVRIINMGKAHSGNDCIVYLETRKMLLAGDIIWVGMHPMVLDPYGSISSWITVLDTIHSSFEIKTIVPGHGAVSTKEAVIEMRDYLHSIHDAVGDTERLRDLRKTYRHLKSIPPVSGFHQTVKRAKKERKKS
ncbi:MAG TPA: MBL fold metallo-hydrolase [Spirochaetia bacterium]|nr:MBL fold metallo-hydrolase [Spirochaetia bacterium]